MEAGVRPGLTTTIHNEHPRGIALSEWSLRYQLLGKVVIEIGNTHDGSRSTDSHRLINCRLPIADCQLEFVDTKLSVLLKKQSAIGNRQLINLCNLSQSVDPLAPDVRDGKQQLIGHQREESDSKHHSK